MEPKSNFDTLDKASAGRCRSLSIGRTSKANAFVMIGAALSLEAVVLLPDQAQASTVRGYRGDEFSSHLEEAGHAGTYLNSDVENVFVSPKFNPMGSSMFVLEGGIPRLLGDAANSRHLPLRRLTFDDKSAHEGVGEHGIGVSRIALNAPEEIMAVQSGPYDSADVMPSNAPFVAASIPDWYEAAAPVSYNIGTDRIGLSDPRVALGLQVSAGPQPATTDDESVTGRAGDFSLDVSATAGFETNPFLIDLPDTGTPSLRLALAPTFSRQGARGDLRVSARLEQIEYTENYDDVQNIGVELGSRFKLSEQVEADLDLSFDSGVFVTNFGALGPIDGTVDGTRPLPGGDDVTLLGLDQPRTQYRARGGFRYQLSARDEIDVSALFQADRFGGVDRQDLLETDFLLGRISYLRQVSGKLRIGVAADASRIDFVEQSLGDITTITPQAVVDFDFSPNLKLTGSLGVTSIRSNRDMLRESSTDLSGDLSICHNGVRANVCLTAARQVTPLGIGGAGLQSNFGVSYSFRLSERETFSLTADYANIPDTLLVEGSGLETINGFLNYQLELTERVRLSAVARYTDLRLDLGTSISNFQALFALTVRLGRPR